MIQKRKSVSNSIPNECYETANTASIGISFYVNPQRRIFFPYALLLSIELTGSDKMIFRFTSAKFTISGDNLDRLYQIAIEGNLSGVLPKESISDINRVWVRQITLEDLAEEETLLG